MAEGWSPELGVSEKELAEAVGRIGARKAPGPDGIPAPLWKGTAEELAPRMRRLFDRCIAWGEFPGLWKEGRMVLLPKPGRPPDSPSAFMLLCLLDEVVKVLERVVAARIEVHMSRALPGLQEEQYGFRRGRSTTDAIIRVRSLVEEPEGRGWVALAVSLDIVNAFNSLPWERIGEALEFHRVPPYLQGVVRAYLRDRCILHTGRGGEVIKRAVRRSVPQGSVLGPPLWSLANDAVLRTPMPPDSALTCYADDTLVLVWGSAWGRTLRLAEMEVACVVASIKGLGLEVSLEKTEAMWFCRKSSHGTPPKGLKLRLGEAEIEVGTQMKYLGLILDSHWTFEAHLEHLAPSVEATANALGRLLPRLGGPSVGVRRLYAGVVRTKLLYGAPIWARELMDKRRSLQLVRRLHRTVATRIVRGFRTISTAAAAVLAGFPPPFKLQALRYREIYIRTRGQPEEGGGRAGADVRTGVRQALLDA
jgi:hypothetical protein